MAQHADIVVIGSGMTGLTCARGLAAAGLDVRVLDKGRGVGGRMATKRVEIAGQVLGFDHGAQYLRPRDPRFAEAMTLAGAVPWPGQTHDPGRVVGMPGMSSVMRALAQGLNVTQNCQVSALGRAQDIWHLDSALGPVTAKRLVLTMPAPQIAALLGPDHALSPALAKVRMTPCLTLMAAFPAGTSVPFGERRDRAAPLSWIAQDSGKPGRTGEFVTWVAQANAAFSAAHLEEQPDDLTARLLPMLCEAIGVDPALCLHARVHRWRYAQTDAPLGQPFLGDPATMLHLGGDWCLGPRAEDGWASGTAIAQDILGAAHAG